MKHPLTGAMMASTQDKQRWSDLTSQSDTDDAGGGGGHSLSDNVRNSDSLVDVERTLKSLNGYHEEILEALQASAHGLAAHEHAMRSAAAAPTDAVSQGRPSPGADSKKAFADPLSDYGGKKKVVVTKILSSITLSSTHCILVRT